MALEYALGIRCSLLYCFVPEIVPKIRKASIVDAEPTGLGGAYWCSGSTDSEHSERTAACLDPGKNSQAAGRPAETGGLVIAILRPTDEGYHQRFRFGNHWQWVARVYLEESMERGEK